MQILAATFLLHRGRAITLGLNWAALHRIGKTTYLSGICKLICYFLHSWHWAKRSNGNLLIRILQNSCVRDGTWLPGHKPRATEINGTLFLLSTTGFGLDTEAERSRKNSVLLSALVLMLGPERCVWMLALPTLLPRDHTLHGAPTAPGINISLSKLWRTWWDCSSTLRVFW